MHVTLGEVRSENALDTDGDWGHEQPGGRSPTVDPAGARMEFRILKPPPRWRTGRVLVLVPVVVMIGIA